MDHLWVGIGFALLVLGKGAASVVKGSQTVAEVAVQADWLTYSSLWTIQLSILDMLTWSLL